MAEAKRTSRAVEAAHRVRQQAVDLAATEHLQRAATLAKAKAARETVEEAMTRAAAEQRIASGTCLSLDALLRFQAWSALQQTELASAREALATAQSATNAARTVLTTALQARQVIERWQARRQQAVRASEQRRGQLALDDSAAQRHGRIESPHTRGPIDGD